MPETKCFAHDHMTIAEYGLWTLGRELSHKTNVLYFDGRNMAKRFRRGGKNAAYKLMHQLIENGWFLVLVPRTRKPNGQWSAHALRVLSHEEWAKEHPKSCKNGAENEDSPVPFSDSACPENAPQPVPPAGHRTGINLQSGKNLQTGESLEKSACPENGTGIRALSSSPTSPKKSETETGVPLVCAACPENGTGPVLKTGQVESPAPKRRTREQLTNLANATHTTVEALLNSGNFLLAS